MNEKTTKGSRFGGEALRFMVALILGLAIAGAVLAFLFYESPEPSTPPAVAIESTETSGEGTRP